MEQVNSTLGVDIKSILGGGGSGPKLPAPEAAVIADSQTAPSTTRPEGGQSW
jgi:hypothetical protein